MACQCGQGNMNGTFQVRAIALQQAIAANPTRSVGAIVPLAKEFEEFLLLGGKSQTGADQVERQVKVNGE